MVCLVKCGSLLGVFCGTVWCCVVQWVAVWCIWVLISAVGVFLVCLGVVRRNGGAVLFSGVFYGTVQWGLAENQIQKY